MTKDTSSCHVTNHHTCFCFPVKTFCFWNLILKKIFDFCGYASTLFCSSQCKYIVFLNVFQLSDIRNTPTVLYFDFKYLYLSFCFLIFVYSVFVRSSMTVTICAYLDCCLSCLAPPVTRLKYTMKLAGTTLLHECKYVLLELGYVVL